MNDHLTLKKLIGSVLIATLVMGSIPQSYAEETTVSQTAVLKTVLTFDECLEQALKENVELKTIDSKIILAKRELSDAKSDAANVSLDRSKSESVYLEEGKKLDLYPAMKEKALRDLESSRQDLIKDIQKNLMVSYVEVFNVESTIKNQQNNLVILEKEYTTKKVEFTKGKITKIALTEYEINLEESKIQLEKLKRDLELAKIEVNRQIGYPLDTQIVFLTKPNIEPIELKVDIEAIIQKAKQNAKAVVDAKYNYDQLLKEMEVINRYTIFNRATSYDALEKKVPDYKKAYEQAIIEAGLNVKTDWMALQNALYDIKIAELKLIIAKNAYDVEKVKFSVGKSTAIAVSKSSNEVNVKAAGLDEAKVNYYKLRVSFEDFMSRL